MIIPRGSRAISQFPLFARSAYKASRLLAKAPYSSLHLRSTRLYSSLGPDNQKPKSRFKILLLLGGLALGSTIYSIANRKDSPKEMIEISDPSRSAPPAVKASSSTSDVSIVFVLGGPGSGKGTQCARIVKNLGFVHIGAGDLLREEQNRPGSKYGDLIRHHIKEGLIVPQEITVELLKQAIQKASEQGKKNFLVDGFPRKMDQAITFEKEIAPSKMVIFFECPEAVMLERLLRRGQTSGRTDDNAESIKKRFRTFLDTSMPVVRYFDDQGKVIRVRCDQDVEDVYKEVELALKEKVL
ncbi:HDR191Cp [Eremothecium sinecaudum]|uniref:Uridylate kinase n=1 Tax=Eremothecium sinecaudum TaxID=45286 RepID=A0A0X8HT55_9SACH|nr:HDR191Cp [Eremothecium sinecaudum]AMD20933.1 HDR191Cp [Eremothecium sinecaudum]